MPDGMFLGAEATQEWERTVQERQELLQGRETEAHVRALLGSLLRPKKSFACAFYYLIYLHAVLQQS